VIRAGALLVAFALAGLAGCGASTIQPGDLPEPGQAVAFARIDVSGIRMSRLAVHRALEGGAKRGPQAGSIRARQGRHTYALYLDPGQYAVYGVLDPSEIENGVPTGPGGILLFDVRPERASYFGSFRMLTESGMVSVADLGQPAFEAARKQFARKYPVLASGFEVVNAVAGTDQLAPEAAADEPAPASGDGFEDEWNAAPGDDDR
jgi:hypothetical protein